MENKDSIQPDDKEEPKEDSNIIWVQSTRKDDRVVLYELDKRHPEEGVALVATKVPRRVYKTPAVINALQQSLIIEVEAPEPPKTTRHVLLLPDGRQVTVDVPVSGTSQVAPTQVLQVKMPALKVR